MWKNTPEAYGAASKLFHWAVAILIVTLLVIGFNMGNIPNGPDKGFVYGMHKSFGITVLILIVARFCWRAYSHPPIANPAHPQWERALASFVHYALYAAAFLMPLSGWGMSSAGGHPVALFGLPLPPLVHEDKALGAYFADLHYVLAWTIVTLVSLHVLGALKHFIIDKDKTLQRMFFGGR